MNCIGWGGGALGPLLVGWIAMHGRHATEMENMSEAIASCGAIYLVGAAALLVAMLWFPRRDAPNPAPAGGVARDRRDSTPACQV
jgi:hypothetical protein